MIQRRITSNFKAVSMRSYEPSSIYDLPIIFKLKYKIPPLMSVITKSTRRDEPTILPNLLEKRVKNEYSKYSNTFRIIY
jgi:hypothetical protein